MASENHNEAATGFDSQQDRSKMDWLDSEPAMVALEARGAGEEADEAHGFRCCDTVEKAGSGSGA